MGIWGEEWNFEKEGVRCETEIISWISIIHKNKTSGREENKIRAQQVP